MVASIQTYLGPSWHEQNLGSFFTNNLPPFYFVYKDVKIRGHIANTTTYEISKKSKSIRSFWFLGDTHVIKASVFVNVTLPHRNMQLVFFNRHSIRKDEFGVPYIDSRQFEYGCAQVSDITKPAAFGSRL